MISVPYVQTMARYNSWQNGNIYEAAGQLTDETRTANRGAFFGSVHATLNHILWADQMWLMRFGVAPRPAAKSIAEGLTQFENWGQLSEERRRLDAVILDWADGLEPSALEGNLTWYSASAGRELTSPKALLITHIFNHQTHHRGQVHALLTGLGVKPGSTDLPFGPPLYAG
jgi:uncharacterized damage-inducible protein DinB